MEKVIKRGLESVKIKEITNCELCGNEDLEEVLNIGEHPLCDDLVPINSNGQCTYPITIMLCQIV